MGITAAKKKMMACLLALAMLFSVMPVHGAEESRSLDFGSEGTSLEDGIYKISGKMLKPDGGTSMSDGAVTHQFKLTVKDGSYDLTMNLKGMDITGLHGYLSKIQYFSSGYQTDPYGNPTGTLQNVSVDSVQKYTDGTVVKDSFGTNYPDLVTFPLIAEAKEDGRVPMQVYVPIMEAIQTGNGAQKVYLTLDWTSVVKTDANDKDFSKEDVTEQAPQPETKPQPVKAPSAPTSVKASDAAYNKVKLTWAKVSGVSGYEIYQNNKKVADVRVNSCTRSGLVTETKYAYKVRAYKTVSGKKVYSGFSKTVTARPTLRAVTGLKVKNSSKKSAKITWKKVSGASGYVVYRGTKKKGKYKAIKTLKKGSIKSYTNKKLKKNKKYYYKVRAYKKVGKKKVYANYSKIVSVKIKK